MLKQYIFLRNDLKLNKGSLIAQACHASVSSIFKYKNHKNTIEYLNNIDDMTKIILKINENDMEELEKKMYEFNILFVKWVEKPENIVTAISTIPIDEEIEFLDYIHKYKLY